MSLSISDFFYPNVIDESRKLCRMEFDEEFDDNPTLRLLQQRDAALYAEEILSSLEKIANSDSGYSIPRRSRAAYLCALIHLSGLGKIQQDVAKGLEWLDKTNMKEANYILGMYYVKGIGLERDLEKGLAYLEKAHSEHYAAASLALGVIYWNGIDRQQDRNKAKDYLIHASLFNFKCLPISQKVRDFFIAFKIECENDPLLTATLIETASPEIQSTMYNRLAVIKFNRAPYAQAPITLWRRILISSSTVDTVALEALCNLGRAFYLNSGFSGWSIEWQDKREALYYWTQAANNGHPRAQYYLGLAYCSGEGTTRDLEEGKKWLREAERQKLSAATMMLNHLEGKDRLQVPPIPEGEPLNAPPLEGQACIESTKPFLSKVWKWVKEHRTDLILTIYSVAFTALYAWKLTTASIYFPFVAVPVWITGAILVFSIYRHSIPSPAVIADQLNEAASQLNEGLTQGLIKPIFKAVFVRVLYYCCRGSY
jgi:TPR repeat protein